MSVITLPFTQQYPTPFGEDACDQYSSSIPHYFIERHSAHEDAIIDPFMGFGTTAFVAESIERIPFGIEVDKERYEWTAGQLAHWQNIKIGDAGDIKQFNFPPMDLCMTSPPWMHAHDTWNPLSGMENGYHAYLDDMIQIFMAVKTVMKQGALLIIHVSDLDHIKGSTPLISDARNALSDVFVYDDIVDIIMQEAPDGLESCSCLIFKNI